jgi:hypothetical protein
MTARGVRRIGRFKGYGVAFVGGFLSQSVAYLVILWRYIGTMVDPEDFIYLAVASVFTSLFAALAGIFGRPASIIGKLIAGALSGIVAGGVFLLIFGE